jgi:hypothetical protein
MPFALVAYVPACRQGVGHSFVARRGRRAREDGESKGFPQGETLFRVGLGELGHELEILIFQDGWHVEKITEVGAKVTWDQPTLDSPLPKSAAMWILTSILALPHLAGVDTLRS